MEYPLLEDEDEEKLWWSGKSCNFAASREARHIASILEGITDMEEKARIIEQAMQDAYSRGNSMGSVGLE